MRWRAPDDSAVSASHAGWQPAPAAAWLRALGLWLLVEAWVAWCFRDSLLAMAGIWARSDTYAHGALVPLVSAWLVWRMRARLAVMPPRPSVSAAALMLLVAMLWVVADLVTVNAVTQFAVVALMVLAVPAMLGWPVARALAFPLGFLFFCVPVGDFMVEPLMNWTADITVGALRLTGVPVYREGNLFHIPSGSWSVVEACSGVRYLIASVVVGCLFAYLNYRSLTRRLAFVAFAIAVPIVANWLRAYLIVMLGHLSGNRIAAGVDHLIYGWLFFGLVMLVMFWAGMRWAEADVPRQGAAAPAGEVGGAPGVPAVRWLPAGVVIMLATTLPWAVASWLEHHRRSGDVVLAAPALADGWQQVAWAGEPPLSPAFQAPSAWFNQAYEHEGRRVGLYVGYYRGQTYDRKLVSSTNVLVTSQDRRWTVVARGSAMVGASPPVTVRAARLSTPGAAVLDGTGLTAWQVYWINGTLTASDIAAKLWGAWHGLAGRGDDAAVIVAYTEGSGAEAEARLNRFLSSQLGKVALRLQAARDTGTEPPP